jgi:hypothetical protein
MSQAVGFTPDGEIGRSECPLHGLNELMMRDRLPRAGAPGRAHRLHLIELNVMSAAMEDQVWARA